MKLKWRKRDEWYIDGYGEETGLIVCRIMRQPQYARLYRQMPTGLPDLDFLTVEQAKSWAEYWYEVNVYE